MAKAKRSKQTKAKKKPVKPAGKGVHWTKEEVVTLMAFVEKGLSFAQIAQNLNRPRKSVESKIYRERLVQRQKANTPKIVKQVPKKKAIKDTQALKVQESVLSVQETNEEKVDNLVPPNKFKTFIRWLLGIRK